MQENNNLSDSKDSILEDFFKLYTKQTGGIRINSIKIMGIILRLEKIYNIRVANNQIYENKTTQLEIIQSLKLNPSIYHKYKSLNKLIPEIQEMVDKNITFQIATNYVSKMSDIEQEILLYMYKDKLTLTLTKSEMCQIEMDVKDQRSLLYESCDKERMLHNTYNVTEGYSTTRIYAIWVNMKKRCYNPNHISYKNYGGRGIFVCEQWLNDFQLFRTWAMENGYNEKLTIDRIDNDGNYYPENCRWATVRQQSNNKRNNYKVTLNGVTKNLTEWVNLYGITYSAMKYRIKIGWSIEDALTKNAHHKIN